MTNKLFDKSQTNLNQSALDDHRMFTGPDWEDWRVFLAVAKAKSYSRAAEELGMSDPTVARCIARLEKVLGVRMVRATRKGIELTDQGGAVANRLIPQAHRFYQIVSEVRGLGQAGGLIRVTATEALAGLAIVPAVPAFADLYPNISLHVRGPVNLLSFRENKTDIMIGFGPCNEAGVENFKVGNLHLVPVASRGYVERYGMPSQTEIARHYFLDCPYYSSATPLYQPWREAVAAGKVAGIIDSPFVYALMAKVGTGIALLGSFTLADRDAVYIDLGIHVKLPIFIYADTESLNVRVMRVVFNWLTEVFSQNNPWFAEDLNLTAFPQTIRKDFFGGVTVGTPLANSHEP